MYKKCANNNNFSLKKCSHFHTPNSNTGDHSKKDFVKICLGLFSEAANGSAACKRAVVMNNLAKRTQTTTAQ